MKCPKCNTEMIQGHQNQANFWLKGDIGIKDVVSFNDIEVIAFRCPECGKIELTSKPDKK